MKFKILKFILILLFIFILLFQNCNLIVYASTENILENQIKNEISNDDIKDQKEKN